MKSLKTEFIAENELIEIITNRNIAQIKLITVYQINKGTYGPFQPLERHTVPIWLAILFKNKHKCKIINPEFLDPSILGLTVYLKDQLQQEQQSLEFSDLPFFYQEISNLLLAL
jgi:GINS complex subunit 2